MIGVIIIFCIIFLVVMPLLACLILSNVNYHSKDKHNASQRILDHFVVKEDKCDLDEFIEFCKNNPVKYNYKNNQEE